METLFLLGMVGSIATFACAAGYRLVWKRRYPWCPPPMVRVRGRISRIERLAPTRYRVRLRSAPDTTTEIIVNAHSTVACRIEAGRWVTVDCNTVLRATEASYRQPGMTEGLQALRIVPGVWPEERWLGAAAVVAAVAALCFGGAGWYRHSAVQECSTVDVMCTDTSDAFEVYEPPPIADREWLKPRPTEEHCNSIHAHCRAEAVGPVAKGLCDGVYADCLDDVLDRPHDG